MPSAYDEFCPRPALPVLHEKPAIGGLTNGEGSSFTSKSGGTIHLIEKGSQAGESAGESFEIGIVQAAARHAFEVRRLILKLEAEIERLNGHALPDSNDDADGKGQPLLGHHGNGHGGGDLQIDAMRADMVGQEDLQKTNEQVEEPTSELETDVYTNAEGRASFCWGTNGDESDEPKNDASNTSEGKPLFGGWKCAAGSKKKGRIQQTPASLMAANRRQKFADNVLGADISFANPCNEQKSLRCIVGHPIFDALAAIMIIMNAATIGVETQYESRRVDTPPAVETIGIVLAAFFLGELILRIAVHQKQWFTDPDMRIWNYFDAFLVGMSLADLIALYGFAGSGASGLDEIKMLKTLRIVRVFRVFRFFRQLTQLALMIGDSVRSLVWAMVLLGVIIYVFAIVITAQATSYIHIRVETDNPDWFDAADSSTDVTVSALNLAFGTLSRTVYTLFQTVLGGVSWGEVTTPLLKVGVLPFVLLLGYISFVVLAVLNVVTGVFVDNAFRSAEKQRSLAIQKEIDRKEQYIDQIKEFFQALDQDGSGDVTTAELAEMLADPTLSAYFRVLGFDIEDATRFVDLLDADESGSLGIEEFLEGCLRLRGSAQAVDVHQIIQMVKTLQRSLIELRSDLKIGASHSVAKPNICL
eukprot:TRINITY_DN32564_c0_g1_i1.p1 TRINITY_DN32564_c0_g1~~TRINITY_DN32564_c0_g1_i1.p1  ORF type:complete len:726 (-),score=144.94 TRINITY_DN32564_c0_g1_i1:151-2079(-)